MCINWPSLHVVEEMGIAVLRYRPRDSERCQLVFEERTFGKISLIVPTGTVLVPKNHSCASRVGAERKFMKQPERRNQFESAS